MVEALRRWMLRTPLSWVVLCVVGVSVAASVGALFALNWILGIGFGPTFKRSLLVATTAPMLVSAPISWVIVNLLRQVEDARRQALDLAWNDALTGLLNRRRFAELGVREVDLAARHGQRLAAALIDLDDFKAVNDRHGHAAGDAVLQAVAEALRGALRTTDLCGRWGGEEFAVLLPGSDASQAGPVLARVLAAVQALRIEAAGGMPCNASIGLAALAPGERFDALIKRADQAMYRAKRAGKGRVVVAGDGPGGEAAAPEAPRPAG